MEPQEFYEKCSTSVLKNLLENWSEDLSGEYKRIIQDILDERQEKGN
jgi:hypothetical protein